MCLVHNCTYELQQRDNVAVSYYGWKWLAVAKRVHTGFVRSLSSRGLSPWISIFLRSLFSKSSRKITISCVQYFILIMCDIELWLQQITLWRYIYLPWWIGCKYRSLNLLSHSWGEKIRYMWSRQGVARPRIVCARNEDKVRVRCQLWELCNHICQQIERLWNNYIVITERWC